MKNKKDPFHFEYTDDKGKKTIGKIVHKIPCKLTNVKTRETYRAHKLVLLTPDFRVVITCAMRAVTKKAKK